MRFVRIGTWLLAAILAVVLSSWVSRPAAAETDLSGNWNANYSLTCTAAITQSGNDLTADTDCGGGVDGTLTGTFDPASSSFSLTGGLGLIPVDVEGAVSPDGGSINGSFSYFPLVADGVFSGTREGTGDDTDLTGNWNITIIDVFSGNCQLAIRQVDSAISALLDCGGSLTGTFEGTIDLATGSMSLAGPFFGSIPLDLDGVAQDALRHDPHIEFAQQHQVRGLESFRVRYLQAIQRQIASQDTQAKAVGAGLDAECIGGAFFQAHLSCAVNQDKNAHDQQYDQDNSQSQQLAEFLHFSLRQFIC